ncbi:MAG: 1-acyl-sn-glycerol-3-phosphate acyltransferase [Actinobacteria bacterium]|nr:1-acyl-sn-glycerol-3-phosphate acyltransferase [Actinomycetota bacterium]MCL6104368.1 1-acyl-sn-glycerol-3-phosphate acyltransferase [Actinomycetota bacterium]
MTSHSRLKSIFQFSNLIERSLLSSRSEPVLPWRKPNWPSSLAKPTPKPTLGVYYDTSWTRTKPSRIARAALVDWLIKPLSSFVAMPTVEGLDRLGNVSTPVIFVANHSSHLDTPLLLCSLPQQFRHKTVVAAAADYFFDKRFKAAVWSFALGIIPMERTKVNRRSAALAEELLRQGWNIIIFPEGTRSPDGWAQRFKGGAAYLSLKVGIPVVPVYISGTRRILAKDSTKLHRYPTKVVFGHPIVPTTPALSSGAGNLKGKKDTEDAVHFEKRIEQEIALLADACTSNWWEALKRHKSGTTPSLGGPKTSPWRRSWELPPSSRSS